MTIPREAMAMVVVVLSAVFFVWRERRYRRIMAKIEDDNAAEVRRIGDNFKRKMAAIEADRIAREAQVSSAFDDVKDGTPLRVPTPQPATPPRTIPRSEQPLPPRDTANRVSATTDRDTFRTERLVAELLINLVGAGVYAYYKVPVEKQRWVSLQIPPPPKSADLACLGLSEMPDSDGLRAAWRKIARKEHPDAGGNAERFVAAQTAYDRLRKHMEAK